MYIGAYLETWSLILRVSLLLHGASICRFLQGIDKMQIYTDSPFVEKKICLDLAARSIGRLVPTVEPNC